MYYAISCVFCGKVIEIDADNIEELDYKMEQFGFTIEEIKNDEIDKDAYYVCNECNKKNRGV